MRKVLIPEGILIDVFGHYDEHLRAIDHEKLTLVLHPYQLLAPVIATPREIVQKFFR